MPGRHINDHQMRLYMKSRLTVKKPAAAAQAAISLTHRVSHRGRSPITLADAASAGPAATRSAGRHF